MKADHISRVIFDYAGRIGNVHETEAFLHLSADMARDLVGADRCSIWLIDDKNQQLWTKVAHGMPEIRIPLGQGIAGALRHNPFDHFFVSRFGRFIANPR